MSENSNKKGKEEKGSGFKPKKKSPLQKRPFNPYWIYVVIAGVLIMQLLVSFSGGLKPIDYKDFVDTMLLQGDVAKVKVIQNEHYAEVFITAEALEKEKYDEVREKGFGQMANTGPHYRMDIPPDEIFKQDLEEDQESIPEGERISAEYENRTNWSDGWLSLLLPIALMVGIWIFIM